MAGILARFLRFGLLAWGGPVAQIAMLRRELVEEERWLDGPRFNRLLAVYQVLPGPEAHELAVHLGFLRAGRLGGLLAGVGFMLPGLVLVLGLAWLYVTADLGTRSVAAILLGANVGVIALVVRAVDRIGRHVVVDLPLLGIAVAAALASLAGLPFWVVLSAAGGLHVVTRRFRRGWIAIAIAVALALALAAGTWAGWLAPIAGPPALPHAGEAPASAPPTVIELFASGLKAGLLTFGGAYTAIPFLRDDAVGSGWLTDAAFLDGLALSGVVPAPLIIFATFVGYVAGGLPGALAMTAGVFLPAFAFGLVFGHRIEAVVAHEGLRRFLEGVTAGVVGLIVVTTIDLAAALADRLPAPALALPILAAGLVLLVRWPSRWAVPAVMALSAVSGWLLFGGPG